MHRCKFVYAIWPVQNRFLCRLSRGGASVIEFLSCGVTWWSLSNDDDDEYLRKDQHRSNCYFLLFDRVLLGFCHDVFQWISDLFFCVFFLWSETHRSYLFFYLYLYRHLTLLRNKTNIEVFFDLFLSRCRPSLLKKINRCHQISIDRNKSWHRIFLVFFPFVCAPKCLSRRCRFGEIFGLWIKIYSHCYSETIFSFRCDFFITFDQSMFSKCLLATSSTKWNCSTVRVGHMQDCHLTESKKRKPIFQLRKNGCRNAEKKPKTCKTDEK